jgi:hypothetical protein
MLWLQTNKQGSGTMNLGGSLTRQVCLPENDLFKIIKLKFKLFINELMPSRSLKARFLNQI